MHDLQNQAQFGLYFGEKLSYAECSMHDFAFYSTDSSVDLFFSFLFFAHPLSFGVKHLAARIEHDSSF